MTPAANRRKLAAKELKVRDSESKARARRRETLMVDEPDNLMLRLLREMREEMAAMKQEMREGFAKVNARLDAHDRTLEAIVRVLGEHTMELAAIRVRQDRMETRLEAVASAVAQGFRATAAALEAHGARLARIERHLGLTTA